MKKTFFLLILAMTAVISQAQYHEFVQESHYWKGEVFGWGTYSYYMHFEGDSTIGFLTYKKLYTSNSLGGPQYLQMLVRENPGTQQVFRYNGGDELLYDFSLTEGEEVTINTIGGPQNIVITSVGEEMVGNTLRKKLNFEDAFGPAYWIEGVGSSYGPIDAALGSIMDYGPVLQCFYEDNELAWSNQLSSMSCDLQLGVEQSGILSAEIWPNPCHDVIYLRTNQFGDSKMEIRLHDVLGKLILNRRQAYSEVVQLDLPDLDSGIYLLSLEVEGVTFSETIFKE